MPKKEDSPTISYFKLLANNTPDLRESIVAAHKFIMDKYPNAKQVHNYYESPEYAKEFINADPTEKYFLAKLTLGYCFNPMARKNQLDILFKNAEIYVTGLEFNEVNDTLFNLSF